MASPLFRLVLVDKANKARKTYAGLVFDNKYDMGIVLNPGVVIDETTQDRCYIKLVPYVAFKREEHKRPDDFEPPEREGDVPF